MWVTQQEAEIGLEKYSTHLPLEEMTEVLVDPHQDQDQDQDLDEVQELVKIETVSGVTNVENIITLLTIIQTQAQMKRQTNYNNYMIQTRQNYKFHCQTHMKILSEQVHKMLWSI